MQGIIQKGVCKVFVTISATLELFMLLIVVGTLRVPSLHYPSAVSSKNMLLIVVGTIRMPTLFNSSRHYPSADSLNSSRHYPNVAPLNSSRNRLS